MNRKTWPRSHEVIREQESRAQLGPAFLPPSSNFRGRASAEAVLAALRRRRLASLRLPPLEDGRRDTLDPSDPTGFRVAPFVAGLEAWELAAEGRRLERAGWESWELAARLGPGWRKAGQP